MKMKLGITSNTEKKLASRESYHIYRYGPGSHEFTSSADYIDLPEVGQKYMTSTIEDVMTGKSNIDWSDNPAHIADGLPGNMSPISAKNGWRGTTDDIAIYACGVRRCVRAEKFVKATVVHVVVEFGAEIID